jgi:hypothetical protein
VPVSETEQPGVAKALGAVVGGAAGLFAGLALVTMLIPGVGLIATAGLAASVAAGAVGGSLLGDALEERLGPGVPVDELYLYEDALRKGHALIFVQVDDAQRAQRAREVLSASGAESIDAARERWWTGLRSAEEETYTPDEEEDYRSGFASAQNTTARGKSYAQALDYLRTRYPEQCDRDAFRRGYERGHRYRQEFVSRE